ncbi:MAG: hypothetical protein QM775_35120 [Pirellulales bacterium]
MSESLSVDLKASLAWLFQDSAELSTVTDVARLDYSAVLGGAPANPAVDLLWHDERSLAAESSQDLILSDLPKTLFGQELSFAFADVRALLLVNLATDAAAELIVGGAPAPPWEGPLGDAGDTLRLPADSCLLLVAKRTPWSVVEGTADVLRIANPGDAATTYRIVIVGVSA